MTILAWFLGLTMTVLGLLHLVWASGAMAVGLAVIPEREGRPIFHPSRLASLAVALLLLTAALLVMEQGGALPYLFPAPIATLGSWTVALAFTARAIGDFRYLGFFKRVRGTRFARWDTWLFAPLCLVLGVGTALIAIR